jgi:hypothetical protein
MAGFSSMDRTAVCLQVRFTGVGFATALEGALEGLLPCMEPQVTLDFEGTDETELTQRTTISLLMHTLVKESDSIGPKLLRTLRARALLGRQRLRGLAFL